MNFQINCKANRNLIGHLALWWWMVFCPLVVGGLFYWLARPPGQTPFLQWQKLPPPPFDLSFIFPNRLADVLPSIIWAFSMTGALWLALCPKGFRQKAVIALVASTSAFLYEIFQWAGVVAGSFDPLDVVGSLVAVGAVCWILKNKPLSESRGI